MDQKSIEDRLEKIENRMKMNFFEIEKRLVNLESAPEETKPDIEKKINQLFDVIMVIRLENEKIKEMIEKNKDNNTVIEMEKDAKKFDKNALEEIKQQVLEIKGRLTRLEESQTKSFLHDKGKGILDEINNILHRD